MHAENGATSAVRLIVLNRRKCTPVGAAAVRRSLIHLASHSLRMI